MQLHPRAYVALFAAAAASVATSPPLPDWTVNAAPFERIITLTEQAPEATCEANLETSQQANIGIELSWAEGGKIDSEDNVAVDFGGIQSGIPVNQLFYRPGSPTSDEASKVRFSGLSASRRLVVGLKADPKTTFPVSVRCVFTGSISGDDDQPANASVVFSAP